MATQFCTAQDGTRIGYDVTGDGPALMLLHGAGDTRSKWRDYGYVDLLKDDFTVITVDMRGFGDSDRPRDSAAYAIQMICDDVLAVADACAIGHLLSGALVMGAMWHATWLRGQVGSLRLP